MSQDGTLDNVALATELTIAWLGNPNTRTSADDVPAFLQQMHETVSKLTGRTASEPETASEREHSPAVSVRKSLASPDHIISMIDGKPYRTLKRHLSANGLTPDEYRQRYGLRADYPMIAPAYSENRSAAAKARGFGRKAGETVAKVAEPVKEAADTAAKKTRRGGKAALDAAKQALGTTE